MLLVLGWAEEVNLLLRICYKAKIGDTKGGGC